MSFHSKQILLRVCLKTHGNSTNNKLGSALKSKDTGKIFENRILRIPFSLEVDYHRSFVVFT